MAVSLEMLHAQSETQKEKHLVWNCRKKIRGLKQQNAITEAALWRLRFRHAHTMVMFFELAAQCRSSRCSYYAASGLGPAIEKGSEDFGGIIVNYKHTPQEWIPIWNRIADKLLEKVRKSQWKKIQGV